MTEADENLLSKVVAEDGVIRILIFRSVARGSDDKPRFLAQSLRYGQIASGRSPGEALRRVIVQTASFLRSCYEQMMAPDLRKNWAPEEALKAFAMAREFTDVPEELMEYFETKRNEQYRDKDVRSPFVEANELTQPLEDFVKAEELVPSW